MDRRTFLKRIGGLTLGLAGLQMAVPGKAKTQILSPLTGMVGNAFLDRKIRESINNLKRKRPYLKIGETHCHSTYSDGNYPVSKIIQRSSDLGLDFLFITEHLTAQKYPLKDTLDSMDERRFYVKAGRQLLNHPLKIYPAFEVSTLQGHMILVFGEEWLEQRNRKSFMRQFTPYEREMPTLEQAAIAGRELDGISIIPHPNIFRVEYPFGAEVSFIQKHLTGLIDGIEDISTGHGYEENYSETLNMASIGSSDDHFNFIIGTTVTAYDSRRHADVLSAIRAGETEAIQLDDSLYEVISTARMIL